MLVVKCLCEALWEPFVLLLHCQSPVTKGRSAGDNERNREGMLPPPPTLPPPRVGMCPLAQVTMLNSARAPSEKHMPF